MSQERGQEEPADRALDEPRLPCVLVVDDDRMQRLLTRDCLESEGYRVVEAEDGDVALDVMHRERPDAVLLDVLMPGRDGFAVCAEIRADPLLHETPIIFVTGRNDTGVVERAFLVEANDFIAKPVFWEMLPYRIRFMLRRERLQRELEMRVEEQTHALAESEHRLKESEKLNALGQLAGGVAHDFNNILMIISGYAGRALKDPEMPKAGREALDHVVKAADRAAKLTSQMLAFSRHQPLKNRVLAVSGLLDELDALLQPLLGATINLEITARDGDARIEADPVHLSQALVNLAINARDAMPRGGRLAIQSDVIRIQDDLLRQSPNLPPGTYVRISVADDGVGLDPDVAEHIFEPFFTTKDQGKGTGLGLAMVYGLVQQLRGAIEVESEPGQGATFTIYLPFVDKPADTVSATVLEAMGGKGETILLAEDDDSLRGLMRMMLDELGYKVLEACDGFEAVEIESDYEQPIDLLLADVVMPNLSGIELFTVVKETRPEIRAVLMSGYPCRARAEGVDLPEGVPLLQKPITANSLAHSVRGALDGQPVP